MRSVAARRNDVPRHGTRMRQAQVMRHGVSRFDATRHGARLVSVALLSYDAVRRLVSPPSFACSPPRQSQRRTNIITPVPALSLSLSAKASNHFFLSSLDGLFRRRSTSKAPAVGAEGDACTVAAVHGT